MKRMSRNVRSSTPALVDAAGLARARGGLVSNFNRITPPGGSKTDSDYNPDGDHGRGAVTNDGPLESW